MGTKYIFISGGVLSGLGKGITTASIAFLLKTRGFKVSPIKCDPYLNIDAGTMNPVIHGETFVTEDGLETDQDLGHYERFINENLSRLNYMTSGQVYLSVINRERNLGYHGKCVESIPHIPQEIISRLKKLAQKTKPDFVLVEIGGTVGEYQNMMFLEAARELKYEKPHDVLNIHVAYLPCPPSLGELKSKPVQTSVIMLNERGVQPDIIIGRAEKPLDSWRIEKIATFCNVSKKDVFSNYDVKTIYEVPLVLEKQQITARILAKLKVRDKTEPKQDREFIQWKNLVDKIKSLKKEIKIGIIGKYFKSGEFSLEDSYVCVIESLKQACFTLGFKPKITWIDSLAVEKKGTKLLEKFDGLIVPQGWGSRGVEGKIQTAGFAREKKVPYLGLCFGMQLACIEFARNVCRLKKANSEEIDKKTPHPVIHIMPDQKEYLVKHQYGGTIRLGAWPCQLKEGTKILKSYKNSPLIYERHRHRYEFNNKYRDLFEEKGLIISGTSPDGKLVESIELKDHPFFIGTQFHPEFKSRFLNCHPLFLAFIKACANKGKIVK